jgi:phage gp37-like protein
VAATVRSGTPVRATITLLFLPALYVAWFGIKEPMAETDGSHANPLVSEMQTGLTADAPL